MKNPLTRLQRIFYRDPDFYIGGKVHPYMRRWWVIPRNRFFNIYLHNILRDDDDRALHDHPWVSCSVILRGGYLEHHPGGVVKRRQPGRITFRRATQAHRLELFESGSFWATDEGRIPIKKSAWTLFITGPKIREWGFHCPKGWRHWEEFVSKDDAGQVGKGCE